MATLEDSVELITNQQPRCPCVLILDTSGSMTGAPIEALNAGLLTLRDDLLRDDTAKKRVEVAVVEFNSTVRVAQDFVTAPNFKPPTLTATGQTDMAGGINQALDLLRRRKDKYNSSGVPYYRPWAFLITDGKVTETDYEEVARRVHEEEREKHVSFFAVGVQGASMECLRAISSREPKMLDGLKFQELFSWLSTSLTRVSQSKVGEMVSLPQGTWEAV